MSWTNYVGGYLFKSHFSQLFKGNEIPTHFDIKFSNPYGVNITLKCVELNVEFLNELAEHFNFPLTIVHAFAEEMLFSAPLNLVGKQVELKGVLKGLHLVLEPIEDVDDVASVWSSAIGRLVEKTDTFKNDGKSPIPINEGAKKVDDFLQFLLSKFSLEIYDSVICLQPRNSQAGVKLNIKLQSICFEREELPKNEPEQNPNNEIKDSQQNNSCFSKVVRISGISFWISYTSQYEMHQKHECQFAMLTGEQKISITMGKGERAHVKAFTELGDFIIFLTPRQLLMLAEFMDEYSNASDDGNQARQVSRPMTDSDYQKLGTIMQQQTQNSGFHGGSGWSGEKEELFYSIHGNLSDGYSAISECGNTVDETNLTSSMMSMIYSERPSSTMGRYFNRGAASNYSKAMSVASSATVRPSHDPGKEMFLVDINIPSMIVILLHEDILDISEDGDHYTDESLAKMSMVSFGFLNTMNLHLGSLNNSHSSEYNPRTSLEIACTYLKQLNLSHLRLFANPVQLVLDVDEQNKKSVVSFKASDLSLTEVLYGEKLLRKEVPLLTFDDLQKDSLEITLTDHKRFNSRRDIMISLKKVDVELDISIMDRLSALFNLPFASKEEKKRSSRQPKHTTRLEVDIPRVNVKLRFPIPDFTPLHDPSRVPWWKRNLHTDFMILQCYFFKLQSSYYSASKLLYKEYGMQFDVIDIFYNRSFIEKPILFAQIGDKDHKYEACRINVKTFPTKTTSKFEEQDDYITRKTSSHRQTTDNGPFTSKRVVHVSRQEHSDDNFCDSESFVPGDSKEIEDFKRISKESTNLILSIVLSSLKIHLTSKDIYAAIYNRICNSLLIWQPSAPRRRRSAGRSTDSKNFNKFIRNLNLTGGIAFSDDDSDSDDDDDRLFESTHDFEPVQETYINEPTYVKKSTEKSNWVLDLKIMNGTIAFNPPVRSKDTKIIPGQLGYFTIDVSEACVFMVNGYKGDSSLDYICVDMRSCDLRHTEMMQDTDVQLCLPDLRRIPGHLYPVISKTMGTLLESRRSLTERPMLVVAIKIVTRHETQHVKAMQISLGLSESTLYHRNVAEPNSWISQLLDFFQVEDVLIKGYRPHEIVREFHFHSWDCAVDYRPLYLPLRCAVTLGGFIMKFSVGEHVKGTKLMFMAEDCDLYLSQEHPPKDGVISSIPIDLRRDYVNVLDLNMLEISLITNEKGNKTKPEWDLKVSNDSLNIHACSDSLASLTGLIGYIASDGDLTWNTQFVSVYQSPKHGPNDQELIAVDPQPKASAASEEQLKEMNKLIQDALNDEKKERNRIKEKSSSKYLAQVQTDLGDSSDDGMDSFVVVDDELVAEMLANNGKLDMGFEDKKGKKISNRTIFSQPDDINDYLDTPACFPIAIRKYTLCELNVKWKLFGGRDFRNAEDVKRERKESNSYTDSTSNYYSSNESIYSRSHSSSSSYDRRDRRDSDRENSKQAGGPNRNKDMLMEVVIEKIRCQYDEYPKNTLQANRFVLQIRRYEIIDKMKNSEINKFLCQYTEPNSQSSHHANMLSVESVNVRPPEMMGEKEASLEITLLPVRLYIDQESLQFLVKFYYELMQVDESKIDKVSPRNSTPIHEPLEFPKLVVRNVEQPNMKHEEDNLIKLDNIVDEDRSVSPDSTEPSSSSGRPIFFRPVVFSPDSFIKLDYVGKSFVSMENSFSGVMRGLVMGLVQISGSKIYLKKISYHRGLEGISEVVSYIFQEWMKDITKHQLPNVLCGLGPMNAIVMILNGIRDLFWLPIEQYQKDGRIIQGIRLGTLSFTTSTAAATLELASKLITILQITAETIYDLLSPGQPVRQRNNEKKKRKKIQQPQDIREGVSNALWLVREGIGETAEAFVQVATQEHEQKGYVGAVGGIARQIPPNLVKPLIIASEASNNVIESIRYQLLPDAKMEANQKWRNTFDE